MEITTNSGAPGGELEVHIRGAASINASDQPLYVVDGIPVDDLNDLNADDIESIDVLKDASSSAIYGSRGANGVILIKTKEAQKTGKVNVQFSASFGIQQMEKKLDVLTPAENASLPWGARLMTLECGMRFLTDHLQNDIYFKIHRENHNLDRARTQFKLVADMEAKWDQMNAIVEKYL